MVATRARRSRHPKRSLSPREIADRELAAGTIGTVQHHRKRERIALTECSSTWGDDLWHGHDRDSTGALTGSGSRKRRCKCCGRFTPPQDVVQVLCTDCRTIAPRDVTVSVPGVTDDEPTERGVKYERDPDGGYRLTMIGDSSPSSALLEFAAARNMAIYHQPLAATEPTADPGDEQMRSELASFDGDIEAYLAKNDPESAVDLAVMQLELN